MTQADPHLMNIELHKQNEELRNNLATAEQALEGCREVLKYCECSTVGKDGMYRCPSCYGLCDSPNVVNHNSGCKLAAALSSTKQTGWVRIEKVKELMSLINNTPRGCTAHAIAHEELDKLLTTRAATQKEQT